MNTVFIYALNDPKTGQTRYVGKTKNLESRFRKHLTRRGRSHRACWIQSLTGQGLVPTLTLVDEVPESEWPTWEVAYIDFFRESGCKLVNGNAGGEGGHNPTEETREKLRAANLGKKASIETRLKLSASQLGRTHSAQTLAKMRRVKEGKPVSDETRARISLAKTGKPLRLSDEERSRRSTAMAGVNNPFFGKTHSPETRAKMSGENHHMWGRRHSQSTREKMSVAHTKPCGD